MSNKILNLKTSDLPLIVKLSAANGDADYLEMKLSKNPATGKIGAYFNRISGPLREFIEKSNK